MRRCDSRGLLLGSILVFSFIAASASADPPGRVARVSFTSGSVSFRPATLDDWTAATLNYPMTTGDNLWTDPNGRAELQLGGTVLRLTANTSVSILNLDDRVAQFRLAQGALAVSVREFAEDDAIEIDTPNGAVSLLASGFYRIDVSPSGDGTTVTVRRGTANMTTGPSTLDIGEGQSAVVAGLTTPRYDLQAAMRPDEWEDWCQWRERRASNSTAEQYVSRETIGYDDLDDFGAWQTVPAYGPVWIPHVHEGWTPYRFGHWVWVDPWGWTWIDDAPWGFAPFHYGRWVSLTGHWGWVPGTRVARPIYAPALVVFVGGPGWGLSVGIGEPIAWFPLGPREPFVPVYRVRPEYLRTINRAHIDITTPIDLGKVDWVNRLMPGGMIAVPRGVFVGGRPVGPAVRRLPLDVIRGAPILGTAARVAPEPASVIGRAVPRGSVPPPSVLNRQVIVRSAPPLPSASFGARQPAFAAHPGQPVDEETLRSLQPRTPSAAAPHPLVRTVAPPAPHRSREPGTPQPPPSQVPRATPPRGASPAPSPDSLAGRSNAPLADLATRQAAERARLEAKHAADQAELRTRQEQQQRRAHDDGARQQVQQKEELERRDLEQRQNREHTQTQQKQDNERRKAEPRTKP
jgi:FecR protein